MFEKKNESPFRKFDVSTFFQKPMKSSTTNVINVRKKELKKKGWRDFMHWSSQPRSLYVGRNMECYVKGTKMSIWHNPFRGPEACHKFEAHIRTTPQLWDRLEELEGKELGCWCDPKPCHAHILVKLLTEKQSQSPHPHTKKRAEKAWNKALDKALRKIERELEQEGLC